MTCRSMVFALALAALTACDSRAPGEFDDFDRAIEAVLEERELEGATAVIVHRDDGIVHLRGYGAFDADRVMLIASAGKVVSAGVLLRLADQGLLDLDAPISTYLSHLGEHKTDITVAQLLSNSSGLIGLFEQPTYNPYLCQYLEGGTLAECAAKIYTADDAADRVPPDTEFRYGGGAWQLAGGIAEVVSGATWAELIAETYVEPCGLGVLGYTNHFAKAFIESGGLGGGIAELPYPTFFDGDVADLPVTSNPNIEGGGYTTAADYGAILLMHLRGGVCGDVRVLDESSVARMQEDRILAYGGSTIDPSLAGYGLGWWIDRRNEGVFVDPGAYGAVAWIDVERGYGAMIMVEADGVLSSALRVETQPILEAIFDARMEVADGDAALR